MSNIEITNEEVVLIISQQGTPGVGVPPGGLEGQVLKKATDENYDTEWDGVCSPGTPASPTAPGTPGTVLYDDSFFYVCIAQDTWRGVPIDTSPWDIIRIDANGNRRITAIGDNRITSGA